MPPDPAGAGTASAFAIKPNWVYFRMDDLARRLVIIDDFLTVGIDSDAASDLFAVLANREHRLPTMIASQTGPVHWGCRATRPGRGGLDREPPREPRQDYQPRPDRHAATPQRTNPRPRGLLGVTPERPGHPPGPLPTPQKSATGSPEQRYPMALRAKQEPSSGV